MSIFNSLGSNYDFKFVLQAFFAGGKPDLAKFLEEKYGGKVTLVYKGREAIELALKILQLPKGSYVGICGFTCFAVYEAIKKASLNVEYLDIEKGELNFSPEILQKKLNENPKLNAVIIQNTLGYPCPIEEISKICQENKIALIEDLAHSVGSVYENGKEAGSMGDFVALSFSQDKMIDAVSGGALVTNIPSDVHLEKIPIKKQIIDRLYPFFSYIIRKSYPFGLGKILHFVFRNLKLLSGPMDGGEGIRELPAWYGHLIASQFKNLNDNLKHRKIIASVFSKTINPKVLSPKIVNKIYLSSNLRFPIFVNNRANLIKFLAEKGIFVSDIWYDAPISPKKYLTQTDYASQCPNSELAAGEIVNLPTHINIDEKGALKIAQAINQWLTQ
ncbi:DegT/DnrJ/EryC1/StrS aminotransferase family protein [Candidatus Daviesbacteria bacterium]|nr:DegT/DnrJ/EryC1/StrS aminotransferase family protein [Candidatus Daviesbacteria bacterium]